MINHPPVLAKRPRVVDGEHLGDQLIFDLKEAQPGDKLTPKGLYEAKAAVRRLQRLLKG